MGFQFLSRFRSVKRRRTVLSNQGVEPSVDSAERAAGPERQKGRKKTKRKITKIGTRRIEYLSLPDFTGAEFFTAHSSDIILLLVKSIPH